MTLRGYLLAIDPGAAPGFAILRDDGSLVQSGYWRLGPRVGQGSGGRFCNLVDNLDSLLRTFPDVASLAFEMPGRLKIPGRPGEPPRDASPETHLSLFGCVAHLLSWAERHGLHYAGFAPSEVKKRATGNGNANKELVLVPLMATRFELDPLTLNPNEADALAIGIAGLVELGCVPPLVLTGDAPAKKRSKKTAPTPDSERELDDFYGDPT